MNFLAALEAALKLAAAIAEEVHDRQMMDAGASAAIKDSLSKGLAAIAAANVAAAAVDTSSKAVANDQNNLDRLGAGGV